MSNRWIKLQANICDNITWSSLTDKQFKAMIGILTHMNWKSSDWQCRKCGTRRTINPGETVRSIRSLADIFDLDYQVVRRTILKLENFGIIEIEKPPNNLSCHRVYIIKDIAEFGNANQQSDTKIKKNEINDNNGLDKYNNSDNITLIKNNNTIDKKIRRIPPTFSEDMLAITDMVKDMVLNVYSGHDIGTIKDWDNSQVRAKWAEYVRRLIKGKKKEVSEIYKVLNWAMEDQFWRKTVKSTSGFYNNYDTIAMQMYGEDSNNNKNTPLSSQKEIRWGNEME